jgi:hypothetical protein
LRALLLTMNHLPGRADPENPLVPFGKFYTLHFARFVILNDTTLDDLKAYGAEFPDAPIYLAFFGDCDGPDAPLLADFAHRAGVGLRQIFAHCEGFDSRCDLLQWMRSHSVKPAATYVNWIGRTVRQIREEAALHEALSSSLGGLSIDEPRQIRHELILAVDEKRIQLTAPAPTPIAWQVRRLLYILAAALAVFLVLRPLLTLTFGAALLVNGAVLAVLAATLAVFLVQLRRHEITGKDVLTRHPELLASPNDSHLQALGALQDYDVTNQYSLIGQLKPGRFARWTTTVIFWAINLASPFLYPRGNLARIKTIHSARWVFLDGKRRVLFASNYDGSAESYMDDFVNKVAFGLNLAFSQGVSYPPTWFVLWRGANYEQEFKNVQRRHALPAEVWYKAYPGLSLFDIERNARIRRGLERDGMTGTEIRQWLAEI